MHLVGELPEARQIKRHAEKLGPISLARLLETDAFRFFQKCVGQAFIHGAITDAGMHQVVSVFEARTPVLDQVTNAVFHGVLWLTVREAAPDEVDPLLVAQAPKKLAGVGV